MNYRHAYHAGNFADVMKHAVLALILTHLRRKPAPFRMIDTHAGLGLYDLDGPEAVRAGEWRDGVGRLEAPFGDEVEARLQPYRDVLAAVRQRHGRAAYPGSPAIAREMLRPEDRGVFVEKHPDDGASLVQRFNTVTTMKVMQMDGWTALGGLIPPKERRGLVLIDPPYEAPDEMDLAGARLAKAVRKWASGVFALWYPIKSARVADAFAERLARLVPEPALRLELGIMPADEQLRLVGSGLIVINPPWRLADDCAILLPALAERLDRGGGWSRAESIGRPT